MDYAFKINHVVFEEYGYLGIVLFDFPSVEVIDHAIKQNFQYFIFINYYNNCII